MVLSAQHELRLLDGNDIYKTYHAIERQLSGQRFVVVVVALPRPDYVHSSILIDRMPSEKWQKETLFSDYISMSWFEFLFPCSTDLSVEFHWMLWGGKINESKFLSFIAEICTELGRYNFCLAKVCGFYRENIDLVTS